MTLIELASRILRYWRGGESVHIDRSLQRVPQSHCGGGTTAQMTSQNKFGASALAVFAAADHSSHKLNLDSAIVNPKCRNAIGINEWSGLGGQQGKIGDLRVLSQSQTSCLGKW